MNKTLLTAISFSALLISLIVTAYPYPVRADSTDAIRFIDSGVTIYSPVNMTYYYGDLFLNVSLYSAGILGGLDPEISMNFSIDGIVQWFSSPKEQWRNSHDVQSSWNSWLYHQLPNGSHYLTICPYGFNQRSYEPRYLSSANTVYFSTTGNPASTPTANPPQLLPLHQHLQQPPKVLTDYPSSNPTPSASITINRTMYAFDGSELLWSFNATAGSRIELNLTLTGDNSFETIFKVESSNHGTIFNSTLYGNSRSEQFHSSS